MLMGDRVPQFDKCARCKQKSKEHFRDRSYCYNCNDSSHENHFSQVPDWALALFAHKKKKKKHEEDFF